MYHDVFISSLKMLLTFEGNYVNDPSDKGGETYKGISRNNFPNWLGWNFIDSVKSSPHFEQLLKANLELDEHVQTFYHQEFWLKMKCAFFPNVIAEELFELSVNVGVSKATKILQTTINVLYDVDANILIDGLFGSITLDALHKSLEIHSNKLILKIINILQGSFYVELMLKSNSNKKYLGWFNRVGFIK